MSIRMLSSTISAALILLLVGGSSQQQCSVYDHCPALSKTKLNVHLVAHSHDDIGWLKTVDQYYYGDRSDIQQAAVQYTIDSVVTELQKNRNRKFIYVETGFFWRWWLNQDEETQAIVRKLVATGQLEFISGGWVMNDEATPHYSGMIDQMTLGLRWLNDTFGPCAVPKIAWQIDPFGHSREQANIFANMGFDGLFMGRIDYQDKGARERSKNMEMLWTTSNGPNPQSLFTSILFNGYNPPDGFCFDILCNDDPINDDKRLFDYNVPQKVKDFTKAAENWAAPYKTKNILMTMGSDFHYLAAHTWYKNLDKLIKYANMEGKINLIYSTPSCYLKAVNEAKVQLRGKSDDFFPYASDPHAFWTGYFTSRATLKGFVMDAGALLQSCKQILTQAILSEPSKASSLLPKLFNMQEPLAVLQHHDAVAGTAKQHVTDDYSKRLSIGVDACSEAISESNILNKEPVHFCHLMNISSCAFTESNPDFVVNVYNPLSWDLTDVHVRIPISKTSASVHDLNNVVNSQVVPVPLEVQRIPGRPTGQAYELVVHIDKIAGFSFRKFSVKTFDGEPLRAIRSGPALRMRADFEVSNGITSLIFSGETGLLKQLKSSGKDIDFEQNFYFYQGHEGNNSKFEWRASGAYIFRPRTSGPNLITDRVFSYHVYKGPVVTEVHQVFTDWISQIVRLYEGRKEVEIEWLVGSIPVEDDIGKEIITKFKTSVNSEQTFYTDANGRQLLQRKVDFRPTWAYKVHEPVAGNYYPVNSRIILQDDASSLTVLNDRTQGGTSLSNGEVELMIHRRLLYDDAFGVGEPLNETQFDKGLIVRGKHWILLDAPDSILHRKLAQEIYMRQLVTFSSPSSNLGSIQLFQSLSDILPDNVHLLTLEPLSPSEILLRLENFYEQGEASVNTAGILRALGGTSMRETALGGNVWLDQVNRFQWGNSSRNILPETNELDSDDSVTLQPMQIRTWVVSV